MMDLRITLPDTFTTKQQRLVLKYLTEGRWSLASAEWEELLAGFNALHKAVIETGTLRRTFRQVYEEYIDIPLADPYINRLLALEDVARDHHSLWAETARTVMSHLHQVQLYKRDIPEANLLLAYCLYFWESFSKGYAFEVEIYQDLTKSGIVFQAHDIRERIARLSPYDLAVLNFKGDIKTSSYFLHIGAGRGLPHDFYITRFYEGKRQLTLVVILQLDTWKEIDGDTITALLHEATRHFPVPVLVTLAQGTVVVAEYEVWKTKVMYQQQGLEE
jgi:hypothetical protein